MDTNFNFKIEKVHKQINDIKSKLSKDNKISDQEWTKLKSNQFILTARKELDKYKKRNGVWYRKKKDQLRREYLRIKYFDNNFDKFKNTLINVNVKRGN